MKKRIFAWLTAVLTVIGMYTFVAFAQTDGITVYLSVSQNGVLVKDKSDTTMACVPVTLSGQDTYDLDDVFHMLHTDYHPEGSTGYASALGDFGLYITKLWGDESGLFGYQVNHGTESVMGLTHTVSDGDFIDVYIMESAYPDSEAYTFFDASTKTVSVGEPFSVTLKQAGYDENFNMVFSPCADAIITIDGIATDMVTDENGQVALCFETSGTHVVSATKNKTVGEKTVTAITSPVMVVTVFPDASITIPNDSTLFVGEKTGVHFVPFTEISPSASVFESDTATYYFDLKNDATYNYRISGENDITMGGTFKKTPDFTLTVTKEMLSPDGLTPKTVDHDPASNNGFNVADIYLNINSQGHLILNENDTYPIIPLRNWQAVNSTTGNYFIEPDFHYMVIDENGEPSDVVLVSENGLMTAQKEGTAIVLVTYDAISLPSAVGGPFFGAIWPENTGVFVVTVGAESDIKSGITIHSGKNDAQIKLSGDNLDCEHDIIYFTGDTGFYTFTPQTDGCTVSVSHPVITDALTYLGFTDILPNNDNSFSVPLTNGRNIIKLEKDGLCAYQIMTAKQVKITVNDGNPVYPGDEIHIVFDTLYHPANKLAGVYNMQALAAYTDVSAHEGKIIGSTPSQYTFASDESAQTITSVLKEKDTWGMITYEKDTALTVPDDYSDNTFTLSGGSIFVTGWGDSYGNHRGITLENGKAPNLNANAKMAWLGLLPDIEIPIVHTTPYVTSVVITSPPAKTTYKVGEMLNPGGMVVSVCYSNGAIKETTDYTYAPNQALQESDTQIIVTYTGMDAPNETLSAFVPITVTKSENGNQSSKTVTVKFSLYGDTKHDHSTIHTMHDDTLEEWILGLSVTVPKGSTVIDVVEKALAISGIPFSNPTGDYIESVRGLSELDNGSLSGWMYTRNGKHPKLSIAEQTVKAGDIIVLHYTDDYTKEKDKKVSSSSGKAPTPVIVTPITPQEPEEPVMQFSDISEEDWFFPAVMYVSQKGWMQGTDTGFAPHLPLTRAMLVTILYRKEGAAPVQSQTGFLDVSTDAWYHDAVLWAKENKIIFGVSETVFQPESFVLREQVASILFRYAQYKGSIPSETPSADLSVYQDADEISAYAVSAMQYAVGAKLLNGKTESTINPTETATRAEIAAILMRIDQ